LAGDDHFSRAGLSIPTGPRLEGRSSASFGERTSRPGHGDPRSLASAAIAHSIIYGVVCWRLFVAAGEKAATPVSSRSSLSDIGGPAWLMLTMRGLTTRLGFGVRAMASGFR